MFIFQRTLFDGNYPYSFKDLFLRVSVTPNGSKTKGAFLAKCSGDLSTAFIGLFHVQ